MKFSRQILAIITAATFAEAFVPVSTTASYHSQITTTTSLGAIGALAKKAKQNDLRKYVQDGIDDSVMEKYNIIKEALEKDSIDLLVDDDDNDIEELYPLQERLTRRKGTITVIAEYKRKLANSGYVNDVYDPEILSPTFREFGAAAIAVMADERMGGCTYDDLTSFIEEQRRARMEVPGPVAVINSDLIIDELQVARSAAMGASAVLLTMNVLGADELNKLMKAAKAVNLETIVAVSSIDEAQQAIDLGARMISIVGAQGVDEKKEILNGINIPEGRTVTTIANILSRNDKQFQEIEETWACRDSGFNCAWVSDALYKAGNEQTEHAGKVIKSMTSKSSLKWASAQAYSGRGEGAREYLGDILM